MNSVSIRASQVATIRPPLRPAAMLLALAGALLLALAASTAARLPWQAMRANLEARHWPAASGSIRAVSLSERSSMPAEGGEPARELVLDVVYAFEADGVVHEGRRASFADRAGPHDRRLRTLYSRLNFALVTGRPVEVAYDPRHPGGAVLDRGFVWQGAALDGGVALFAGLLGLWLAAAPLRRVRRPG